jgi:hypothetical protein
MLPVKKGLNPRDLCISSVNLEKFQETNGAFDFLKDSEEITYKPSDGDPV